MTICALDICAGKQKTGENMNRKIMILMVAVVATVLPAVAVKIGDKENRNGFK